MASSAALEESGEEAAHVEASAHAEAAHVFEDLLIGLWTAALVFDNRMSHGLAADVLRLLLDARRVGRERELLEAAHEEAAALPEWVCVACHEPNPGTFDYCWNCSAEAVSRSATLSAESEALLTAESLLQGPVVLEPTETGEWEHAAVPRAGPGAGP